MEALACEPYPATQSTDGGHDRKHCWECERRYLVCDSTRPSCMRCSKLGVVCPGYGAMKPVNLKWLSPGQVKSRKRRPKIMFNDHSTGSEEDLLFTNAQHIVPTSPCFQIRTVTEMLVQAAEYFNLKVGPSVKPMNEITPNFGVPLISPVIFQNGLGYPDHVRLVLVCTSLGHLMCQSEGNWIALYPTFFYFRGLIIKSLRDDINCDEKRTGNFVIAGMLTLLLIDVRQGISHKSWRYHLDGVRTAIQLRGGFRVFGESPGAMPLLHSFMVFAVLGDTSSPASDLSTTAANIDEMNDMMDRYSESMDLFRMFPAPLFAEAIKINHLRMRAVGQHPPTHELTSEGYEILRIILAFNPDDWATMKATSQSSDFVMIGGIYKAAVALYCISSLQSLLILPTASFLTHLSVTLTQCLEQLISEALPLQKFQRLLLWPLVVLGVQAAKGHKSTRGFVRDELLKSSCATGIYTPRMAKDILEAFWSSGKFSWDDCFREPYMLWSLQGIESRGLWRAIQS